MAKKKTEAEKVSPDNVMKQIDEKRKELVNLRFQLVSNQLKDVKLFQKTRREIARLLTTVNAKKKG